MQVCEKYQSLAREAMRVGNRVAAENLMQHAEHYYRVLSANGVVRQGNLPRPRHGGDHTGLGANPPGPAPERADFAAAEPGDQGPPRDREQAGPNGPMDAPNQPPAPRRERKPPRRRPVAAKVEAEGKIEAEAGPKTASSETASSEPATKPGSDHAA